LDVGSRHAVAALVLQDFRNDLDDLFPITVASLLYPGALLKDDRDYLSVVQWHVSSPSRYRNAALTILSIVASGPSGRPAFRANRANSWARCSSDRTRARASGSSPSAIPGGSASRS